jgi:hypothetical protein
MMAHPSYWLALRLAASVLISGALPAAIAGRASEGLVRLLPAPGGTLAKNATANNIAGRASLSHHQRRSFYNHWKRIGGGSVSDYKEIYGTEICIL